MKVRCMGGGWMERQRGDGGVEGATAKHEGLKSKGE